MNLHEYAESNLNFSFVDLFEDGDCIGTVAVEDLIEDRKITAEHVIYEADYTPTFFFVGEFVTQEMIKRACKKLNVIADNIMIG